MPRFTVHTSPAGLARLDDGGLPILAGPEPELQAFAMALNLDQPTDVRTALLDLIEDTRDCSFAFMGEPFDAEAAWREKNRDLIERTRQMDLFVRVAE